MSTGFWLNQREIESFLEASRQKVKIRGMSRKNIWYYVHIIYIQHKIYCIYDSNAENGQTAVSNGARCGSWSPYQPLSHRAEPINILLSRNWFLLLFRGKKNLKRKLIIEHSFSKFCGTHRQNVIVRNQPNFFAPSPPVCVCMIVWISDKPHTHRSSRWLKVSADYWFPAAKLLKVSQLILAGWARCR